MNYNEETTRYYGNDGNENKDGYINNINKEAKEVPKSESQLWMALGSQRKSIENLCHHIAELREELAPVLIPQDEEPATRGEGSYPCGLCTIARQLYEHGDILERATRDIVQTRRALAV